ncbi:hypothetical protein HPP92_015142 [Vanilla planifolia]|uniref:Uncharacterized protein n=1 Tax=Vanilla planifolia TaxID=51239 RepID=A0A835QHB2_VANPL|nr:hypothetical protein HPP92_015142 [Vanilla planifolia]
MVGRTEARQTAKAGARKPANKTAQATRRKSSAMTRLDASGKRGEGEQKGLGILPVQFDEQQTNEDDRRRPTTTGAYMGIVHLNEEAVRMSLSSEFVAKLEN